MGERIVMIGPIDPAEDNIMLRVEECQFLLDKTSAGIGTLFITRDAMCWKENGKNEGISIPWTKVSIHAITNTPQRCIYLMLDFLLVWPGITTANRNGNAAQENDEIDDEDNDEGHVEDEDQEISEITIIPANVQEVDRIYAKILNAQILNPDPDSLPSDDDEEFMEALDEEGHEELREDEMQNLRIEDDGRFADADEDYEEGEDYN